MNIQNRRECFFDDYLINMEKTTAEFVLHQPQRKETVMVFDKPWEGDHCGDICILHDGEKYIMYYVAQNLRNVNHDDSDTNEYYNCYATSVDGIHWERPNLGRFDYKGSIENNIIDSRNTTGHAMYSVFIDTNPDCPPDEKYKALRSRVGDFYIRQLKAYVSADGIDFKEKYLVEDGGYYDTMNLAFWDDIAKKYRCYTRGFHAPAGYKDGEELDFFHPSTAEIRIRDIRYLESQDFVNWTESRRIDMGDVEDIELYTNQAIPYYRAPHMILAFPTRYNGRKVWTKNYDILPDLDAREERSRGEKRYGLALTDCAFMVSRDGENFTRYEDAFLKPGPECPGSWVYGDCYPAYGVFETKSDIPGADNELSVFVGEGHWNGEPTRLARYTIRLDGFVSLHAGGKKEEIIVTKPFIFEGKNLYANISTSARGYMYFTLKAKDGTTVKSCEIFGDKTDRFIPIDEGNMEELSGKEVVMEIRLRDADIYSIRFGE